MYTINHVGMAVPDIAKFLVKSSAIFTSFKASKIIVNETQKVREVFFTDGRTVIELLEPMGDDSPLASFLQSNPTGGLVHVCYECDDIDESIIELKETGAKLISGPTPDVAFGDRPIAFLFLAGQVVELVQR